MALAVAASAKVVKPLRGSVVRRVTLGATVAAGAPITEQSDGYWDESDSSAVQLTVRIAVQGGVVGDKVDSVCFGPVAGITGATPGALVYLSDTAGELSHTAGTKSTIVGYAPDATTLFVQPQIVDLT